jgi:hypothetical protein
VSATEHESAAAEQVIEACVAHARQLLASELPIVESRSYDFMPSFKEMTTQLYLVGVMWRFGEQFELPTSARDRGFICLMSMLVSEGMNAKEAQSRIAHLSQISRTSTGQETLAIAVGYEAKTGDGSLATVFDAYRNAPEVSGAPYRLLDRSKPIAAILAASGIVISLLVGRSWGEAIGVGVVLGAATLAIALAIYHQTVKAKGQGQ